jgi:chromosome segregation ATPase
MANLIATTKANIDSITGDIDTILREIVQSKKKLLVLDEKLTQQNLVLDGVDDSEYRVLRKQLITEIQTAQTKIEIGLKNICSPMISESQEMLKLRNENQQLQLKYENLQQKMKVTEELNSSLKSCNAQLITLNQPTQESTELKKMQLENEQLKLTMQKMQGEKTVHEQQMMTLRECARLLLLQNSQLMGKHEIPINNIPKNDIIDNYKS